MASSKTVTPSTVDPAATSTHILPVPQTSVPTSDSSNAPAPQNLPTTSPISPQSLTHQPLVNTSQPISQTPIALKTRSRTSHLPPLQARSPPAYPLSPTKPISHKPPTKSRATSPPHTSQTILHRSHTILQS